MIQEYAVTDLKIGNMGEWTGASVAHFDMSGQDNITGTGIDP
jgi:hypothetical protein